MKKNDHPQNMNIHSTKAPEPVGAYPHAKAVGPFLFLSGVGPRQRGTKEIPGVTLDAHGNIVDYDIRRQAQSVFDNIKTILEDAGASLEHLVDVTVFLTNMKKDFKIYNEVYAQWVKTLPSPPTRTTVEINALPTPIAIELKCIAYLPSHEKQGE